MNTTFELILALTMVVFAGLLFIVGFISVVKFILKRRMR